MEPNGVADQKDTAAAEVLCGNIVYPVGPEPFKAFIANALAVGRQRGFQEARAAPTTGDREPRYTALTPEEHKIWQMGYDKRGEEFSAGDREAADDRDVAIDLLANGPISFDDTDDWAVRELEDNIKAAISAARGERDAKWTALAEELITAFEKMDNDFDEGIEITDKTYRRYVKARDALQAFIEGDDISDAQLAEVIGKANNERTRAVVGKVRAYYRDKAAARVKELEEELIKWREIGGRAQRNLDAPFTSENPVQILTDAAELAALVEAKK